MRKSLVAAIEELTAAIAGPPPQNIRLAFRIGPAAEQTTAPEPTPQFQSNLKGVVLSMSQLTATQQVLLLVRFTDRLGNPAPVDEPPEWLVDNPNVVALEPAADGMSCLCKAVGPIGIANVTLRADADLGDGTEHIVGTHEFEIVAGEAVSVEITVGTPASAAVQTARPAATAATKPPNTKLPVDSSNVNS